MRCDGNEPCGPCQSTTSDCHYTASTAPSIAPSLSSHAELGNEDQPSSLPNGHGFTASASPDHEGSQDLNFATQHPNLDVPPTMTSAMEGIQTYPNTISMQFHAQSVYDPTATNDNNLSLGEDMLYPLPDGDGMNDFWQMPTMNSQFWFDGSDFAWTDNFFDSNSPLLDHVLSSSMQNLTAIMQEYFDRKSRAPSPSLNKASKMWYSAPPNLDDHNKDIVKVFLQIFRRNIPQTFSLFKDCTVSRKSRAEYTLAMAAIGGLFCTVAGSSEVAKSMYNDARRLLLASFNVRSSLDELSTNPDDKLTVVKTFILLELYGLCSGDKRSYEFVEAFHGNLIHVTSTPSQVHGIDKLMCSKSVQEYSAACKRFASKDNDKARSRLTQLHQEVVNLTDTGHISLPSTNTEFDLASLSSLTSHLWPALYPRQNTYGADNVSVESLSLWKRDFAELACDTWLRTRRGTVDFSCLAVYHMMNIMLHANLTVLQNFAHSAPGSAARDPKKSLAAREVYAWTQDRHYKIAQWHAENLIISIEGAFTAATKMDQQGPQQPPPRASFSTSEPRRLPYEAPHVPYAVYYATLVLWCGAVIEESGGHTPSGLQAPIARGERILSLHKVHIAQLLARVLNEIK
ncbi:hypothetical protein LTS17_009728 [Exophiala oligosperma]